MRPINKFIVHCSDTPDDRDVTVNEIRKWHEAKGWDDIGYHYVIYRNGDVMCGRPVHKVGAHVFGHNADSIGICLIGRKGFTENQFSSLKNLYSTIKGFIPKIEAYGHRDFTDKKTCPNFNVKDVL